MMLGMNAPKAVAKGEYAKAIRKAVHDSIEAIKNGKVPEKKNQKFNFEWRVQIFVTVLALHKDSYSAVPFYEKCNFAKQTPLPKADVWPMYKTLWVEQY